MELKVGGLDKTLESEYDESRRSEAQSGQTIEELLRRQQTLEESMNKLAIALLAASTLASAPPAQAGMVNHSRPQQCMPGYQFYPDKHECIEMHLDQPKLVEKAGCKVGEFRQVPDPSKPGGFRIQECLNPQAE
ncbi:MAG TPA: hypothetical protein VMR46_03425 [Candidatus Paceibacterota bacterium]|nr:hypothetical protein [Candidatus Paceibacterota bacterium]